jgi:hypothetical protein
VAPTGPVSPLAAMTDQFADGGGSFVFPASAM